MDWHFCFSYSLLCRYHSRFGLVERSVPSLSRRIISLASHRRTAPHRIVPHRTASHRIALHRIVVLLFCCLSLELLVPSDNNNTITIATTTTSTLTGSTARLVPTRTTYLLTLPWSKGQSVASLCQQRESVSVLLQTTAAA